MNLSSSEASQQFYPYKISELKYQFWRDCNSTADIISVMSGCVFSNQELPPHRIQTNVLFLIRADTFYLKATEVSSLSAISLCLKKNTKHAYIRMHTHKSTPNKNPQTLSGLGYALQFTILRCVVRLDSFKSFKYNLRPVHKECICNLYTKIETLELNFSSKQDQSKVLKGLCNTQVTPD